MKAKDVRFKILINNSETQLIKNFFRWQFVLIVKKIYLFHRKLFFSKFIWNFFFQNWMYNLGSGSGPWSGSKLAQNPWSGSKFNVFGSTLLICTVVQSIMQVFVADLFCVPVTVSTFPSSTRRVFSVTPLMDETEH